MQVLWVQELQWCGFKVQELQWCGFNVQELQWCVQGTGVQVNEFLLH